MKTTTNFLDDVKRRLKLRYDTELANTLGLNKAQITNYRRNGHALGDEVAGKVAEILELHPGYVLACVHYERAGNSPTRGAWQAVADQFIGIDRTSYNAYYVKLNNTNVSSNSQCPSALQRDPSQEPHED